MKHNKDAILKIAVDFEFEGGPLPSNSKTAQQWFRLLLDPYEYDNMIDSLNLQKGEDGADSFLEQMFSNPASAVNEAFTWSETEQGHDYWNRIYERMGSYNPDEDEPEEDDDYDEYDGDEDDDW